MLPTSAGVEPMTSWSPVRRRIQLSHRGRQIWYEKKTKYSMKDEKKKIPQSLYKTVLVGTKANTILAKQTCCIQTKMYRFMIKKK